MSATAEGGRTDWRIGPAVIKNVAFTILSGPSFDGAGGVYELHIAGMPCEGTRAAAESILRDLQSHAGLVEALENLERAAQAHLDCTDGSEREYLREEMANARAALSSAKGEGR